MRPTTQLTASLSAAVTCLILAVPIRAEETDWEITPTIGYRTESSSQGDFIDFFSDFEIEDDASFGLTVERRITNALRLELLWSRQQTRLSQDRFFAFQPDRVIFDLNVDQYHVGLLYQWNPGKIRPFVVGSIGATVFDPEPSNRSTETRFSASAGGGAKFMFGDHVGLRLEGRIYTTRLEDNDDFYCDDYCSYNDDFFVQGEARAGLIFAF